MKNMIKGPKYIWIILQGSSLYMSRINITLAMKTSTPTKYMEFKKTLGKWG